MGEKLGFCDKLPACRLPTSQAGSLWLRLVVSKRGELMARLMGMLCMAMAVGLLLGSAGAQEQKKGTFDIDAIFKKLDTDSDGKLSKDEFLKLADRFKDKEKARAKLTKAFEKLDTEKTGLTKVQFRKYVESVKKKDETQ
jgi:hypothetical protein